MSNDLFYKSGSWNLICDVCGKKVKADDAKHRWDGLIVCKDDWELRHPLDFIKARVDKIIVPYARPRPPDVFVTGDYLITENSNIRYGDTIYITTEDLHPITTE